MKTMLVSSHLYPSLHEALDLIAAVNGTAGYAYYAVDMKWAGKLSSFEKKLSLLNSKELRVFCRGDAAAGSELAARFSLEEIAPLFREFAD